MCTSGRRFSVTAMLTRWNAVGVGCQQMLLPALLLLLLHLHSSLTSCTQISNSDAAGWGLRLRPAHVDAVGGCSDGCNFGLHLPCRRQGGLTSKQRVQ